MYGREIGITWSTPGSPSRPSSRTPSGSPIAPIAVVSSPGITFACTPRASSLATTASICSGVASGVITTIMGWRHSARGRRAASASRALRARTIVTIIRITTPSGKGISTQVGMPRPALMRSAMPAPIRTTASVVRSTAGSTRTDQWLPSHTPGTDPIRMFAARPKSTLPATMCARPAAQSRIAAWKMSVPTTRLGVSRNNRMSPTAISAPLPAEVIPSTKPTHRPSTTAATLWRVSSSIVSRSRSCIDLRKATYQGRRSREEQGAGEDREQQVVEVAPGGVLDQAQHIDAADGRGHRAERHPAREPEVDRLLRPVLVAPAPSSSRPRRRGPCRSPSQG